MIINQHCPSPLDVHPRNPRSVKLREQTILWLVDPWAESILGNSWGLSAFLWITGNMVSCFRDLWTDDGIWLWCSLLAKVETLIIALQKCFIPKRSADPNISQYTLINIYHLQHIGICASSMVFHRGPTVSPFPKAPMGLSNRSISSGCSASTTKVSSAAIQPWLGVMVKLIPNRAIPWYTPCNFYPFLPQDLEKWLTWYSKTG